MVDNLKSFLDATAGMSLVDKAFADAETPHRFLGGEMSEHEKGIIRRVCELLDTHSCHSGSDKESIKAAAVLVTSVVTSGMMFVFDDTRRFKPGYSDRVDAIVNDFLTGNLSEDLSEITLAQAVAMTEDTQKVLTGPDAAAYVAALPPEAFAPVEKQLEGFNLPQFQGAPALLALAKEKITEVSQIISQFKPGAGPVPARPHP